VLGKSRKNSLEPRRLAGGCNERSLRSGLRTPDKLSRAACEWSKGGAKGSLTQEGVLQLLFTARFWRLFLFSGVGLCVGYKKDDKTAARSDQQASLTRAAVGCVAAERNAVE